MQENLILLRKKNDIKQQELADLLEINVKTYNFKEIGRNEFTMNEMFKIANFFHKTVEEIFLPTILQNGVKNRGRV
jgi:putative transcriptional regulator